PRGGALEGLAGQAPARQSPAPRRESLPALFAGHRNTVLTVVRKYCINDLIQYSLGEANVVGAMTCAATWEETMRSPAYGLAWQLWSHYRRGITGFLIYGIGVALFAQTAASARLGDLRILAVL